MDPEIDGSDPDAVARVPLLIKFARQRTASVVSEPLSTDHLLKLIQWHRHTNDRSVESLAHVIKHENWYTQLDPSELESKLLIINKNEIASQ